MKVLNPIVSIVMASHMKPEYLPTAVYSVLDQTRQDFELIVVDSGEWINQPNSPMEQVYQRLSRHPLIEWVSLGESPRLIERACPYAYIWNMAIRDLVRGKYVCFFTDDDLYKPNFLEEMVGYLNANPEAGAVFCAQDRERQIAGEWFPEPGISADTTRSTFDNYVDMIQMMVRYQTLMDMSPWDEGDVEEWRAFQWFPEDPADASCRHADGQFMDKVGQLLGEVPNIPQVLCTHRYTPVSTYN